MLSWVLNTYKGEELMGHFDLVLHTANLDLLLPKAVLNNLQQQYLDVRMFYLLKKVVAIDFIEHGKKLYGVDAKYFIIRKTRLAF